jgi:phosphoglycerate dehydrogenase-like enzyme
MAEDRSTSMKRVAVLEDYQNAARSMPQWARLEGRAAVDFYHDAAPDLDALATRLAPYPIVVPIRERTRFPAALLDRLPSLELLALTGRMSGHVDLAAATARGILVTETEGSGAAAIELTMGLILAAVRRIPQEDHGVRIGGWQSGIGIELRGKSLGIVGLGRIGSRIAEFGRFLGMHVVAWGPTLTAERAAAAGATQVPLDDLFRQSDVVSVHLRLSERTHHVITGHHLALMKPRSYLVNTARGELVDEEALVDVLRERRIAGAALDVYEREPLPVTHPLRTLDNVVLSPHMGYVTVDSYTVFFTQAVDAIVAYLEGGLPPGALNPEVMTQRTGREMA